MTVKIVTDSTADIPQALADKLGIAVVPLYVQFGQSTYRDRVDISEEEFYERLLKDLVHPGTSQPTPQDFAEVYKRIGEGAEGIVSVHISTKLSGTCSSALQGKEMVKNGCPVEVIDSEKVSMGLGLLAIGAAELAAAGKTMEEIVEGTKKMIPDTHVWALFDTLKYLAAGGRIGKSKALMGSVLNIKPILAVKDWVMAPATQARSRNKGIAMLNDFGHSFTDIRDMALMYTTTPDEAATLADLLGDVFDRKKIKLARLGPALGVHAGPGALAIAVRGKGKS